VGLLNRAAAATPSLLPACIDAPATVAI